MPFCTNHFCKRKGENLPVSEFEGAYGRTKQCSQCRDYQNKKERESRARLGSTRIPKEERPKQVKRQGKPPLKAWRDDYVPFSLTVTPPGDPPKFRTEADKRRFDGWLRGLVEEVIRASKA